MVAQRKLRKYKSWFIIAFLIGMAFVLFACDTTEPPPQCPDLQCPEVTVPEPVLYEDLWATSAHADKNAEPFTHWDEEDPPEIPEECAKCHSKPGFIDFLGIDGSTPGEVNKPAQVGTTITCYVCHNEVSLDLNYAEFPSGVKNSRPWSRSSLHPMSSRPDIYRHCG